MSNDSIKDIREWLNSEIKKINNEIDERKTKIKKLEKIAEQLKDYEKNSEYKEKYEETSKLYKKEQERLIKLHSHYQKTETECKDLRKEIESWKNWFNNNKDMFDKLFSKPPMTTKNLNKKAKTQKKKR